MRYRTAAALEMAVRDAAKASPCVPTCLRPKTRTKRSGEIASFF